MQRQQQSPIQLKSPIVTRYADPLRIRWSPRINGELACHDGSVRVTFSGDKRELISFDGRDFHIVEFHFHHKSEHWVEGKQYPLELHMVHRDCDSKLGGLAVIGVMIESDNSVEAVPELVDSIERFQADDTCQTMHFKTNPREWLPRDWKHYYRYEGSLTTPDYDEIVSWIVLKETLRLPRREINKLIRHAAEPARLPQPLCRRFVLANF